MSLIILRKLWQQLWKEYCKMIGFIIATLGPGHMKGETLWGGCGWSAMPPRIQLLKCFFMTISIILLKTQTSLATEYFTMNPWLTMIHPFSFLGRFGTQFNIVPLLLTLINKTGQLKNYLQKCNAIDTLLYEIGCNKCWTVVLTTRKVVLNRR